MLNFISENDIWDKILMPLNLKLIFDAFMDIVY